MIKDDAELDKELAAYSDELRSIGAPAALRDKILSSIEQDPNLSSAREQSAWITHRFWLSTGCAASIAVISFSLFFAGGAQKPQNQQSLGLLTTNSVTNYPVRVHSMSQGAQWGYVQSQTVKDQRGITRLLVVNPSRR